MRSGDAAEYVLGTLEREERRTFETALETDVGLQNDVRFWRARFAGLDEAMPSIVPPAQVWNRIDAAMLGMSRVPAPAVEAANDNELRSLRRSRNGCGGAFGALAAVLAVAQGAIVANPDLTRGLGIELPGRAEAPLVAGRDTDQRYVAVVNRDGALPALIVHVDARSGNVTVRQLGLEQPEADKSLELWWIPEGQPAMSVGLLDRGSAAIEDVTPEVGGTFAVTLEAKGGTPTGTAQGPVVYSGKLVPDAD